jgi:hypothetical protein
MSVHDAPPPTDARHYAAHPPIAGSQMASVSRPMWGVSTLASQRLTVWMLVVYGAVMGLGIVWAFANAAFPHQPSSVGLILITCGLLLFTAVAVFWHKRPKTRILLTVNEHGLAISTRPDDVYRFEDAKLGTWRMADGTPMGTALHLRWGARRLVLGGRDRSAEASEVPDVGYALPVDVDAWLPAAEFEEILGIAARRRRPVGVQDAAPITLRWNPLRTQMMGLSTAESIREYQHACTTPRLTMDVHGGGFRMTDAVTGATVTTVVRAQFVATPATYRPMARRLHTLNSGVDYSSTMPGIHLALPGLTFVVGVWDQEMGPDLRFRWMPAIATLATCTDYVVSGTDWMRLVTLCGLDQYHVTHAHRTPIERTAAP